MNQQPKHSYTEALDIVISNAASLQVEMIPVEQSLGRVLAEDIKADRDFPPFDRVTMDGIAVHSEALTRGRRQFAVEKVIAAGDKQDVLSSKENCVEIMTGAVLPLQADTIIRYEDVEITEGIAHLKVDKIKAGQNVHFRGLDHKKGDLIVERGCVISPAEISVAATVGKHELKVVKPLRTVIISTGDELVPIDQNPQPHQIRRSNAFMLQAALRNAGWESDLMHLPDEKNIMKNLLEKAFKNYQLLLFSGAVSKGKFDFLPEVLKEMGVEEHFHKVRQRPGKPFWFGTTNQDHYVFAFPGNPVSTFMCCYTYLMPWIHESQNAMHHFKSARLAADMKFEKPLTLFQQVRTTIDDEGVLWAHPIKSHGSGDFVNLVNGDGIIILPEEKPDFKTGETYQFISYRS
jgi:molybdopterin molybdotransferase